MGENHGREVQGIMAIIKSLSLHKMLDSSSETNEMVKPEQPVEQAMKMKNYRDVLLIYPKPSINEND